MLITLEKKGVIVRKFPYREKSTLGIAERKATII